MGDEQNGSRHSRTNDELTDRISRRRLLKTSSAGLLGLSTVGFASAASNENDRGRINSEFNPSSEKQLRRFLKQFKKLEEEDRSVLWKQLTRNQQEAIFDAEKVETTESEVTQTQSDDGVTTLARSSTWVNTLTAKSSLGFVVWKFNHEINWNYNYNGQVWGINTDCYPSNLDVLWNWKGQVAGYVNDEGNYFDSFKKGSFQFCAGGSVGCGFNAYPYSELRGYNRGGYDVERASKDCGQYGGC